MKIIFFIAVWVNIFFFLWESNFANLDTDHDGDVNAVKQILLQSEFSESNKKNTIVKASDKNELETNPSIDNEKDKKISKIKTITKGKGKKITKDLGLNATLVKKNKTDTGKIKTNKNASNKGVKPNNKMTVLQPEHCYHIGPFKDPDAFDQWKVKNKIDSASVVLLKKNEQTFRQYMVYFPGTGSDKESKGNMVKIKELGIEDAWLFEKGDFKGGISLGLYDREEPAKLRVKEVALLFIDSEIKVIEKTKSALYAKVSKIKNNTKQKVILSSKQVAIDCVTK